MSPTVRRTVYSLAVLVLVSSAAPHAQDGSKAPRLEGLWLGTLKTPMGELRLGFRVTSTEGKLVASLDSIDQGVKGLAVDETTYQDAKVRFSIKVSKATFEGTMNKEGTEIVGEWKQGPGALPLTLKRVDKFPGMNRPQEPKGPFPYVEEEVSYENKKAKVKFAGTLTLPKGDGPFPAVLLITGSGPQDRNEEIFGHKPFLLIADYLTRRGIAVLRVDDRGVGGSTGDIDSSTTADFAEDALVGIEFLKNRKEIDAQRIGLIGHSEGGIIAPLAASQSKDVAFIVMLAGPGLPGDEIILLQTKLILEAAGISKADVDLQLKYFNLVLPIVKQEADPKVAQKRILEEMAKWKDAAGDDDKKGIEDLIKLLKGGTLRILTSTWYRHFVTQDPRPALRKVQCPVLALNGEKDLQVPAKANLEAITKALNEAGNKDFTVKELPKLNHLFQTCKTGSLAEYGIIEETMAPAVLELMGDWIVARTK